MLYLLSAGCILNFWSGNVVAEDTVIAKARQQQGASRSQLEKIIQGLMPAVQTVTKKSLNLTGQGNGLVVKSATIRDPFAIPPVLLKTLADNQIRNGQAGEDVNYAFARATTAKIPNIKLKGVMHGNKRPSPLAVVQLNNETYMVRENDELGFNPANPAQVIKVIKINRLSMLVEVGTLGEVVIVR